MEIESFKVDFPAYYIIIFVVIMSVLGYLVIRFIKKHKQK